MQKNPAIVALLEEATSGKSEGSVHGSQILSIYNKIKKLGEKDKLVKEGVDLVMKRYPDYARMVKSAFSAPLMTHLRERTAAVSGAAERGTPPR